MLTATPIQNRLWDLYSLVDLLTVARGHENPFGSEGMFARRFIADDREKARQLKAGRARRIPLDRLRLHVARAARRRQAVFPEPYSADAPCRADRAELELIR